MATVYRLIKFEGSNEAVQHQLNMSLAEGKYNTNKNLSISILDLNENNLPGDPSFLPGIESVPLREQLTKHIDKDATTKKSKDS